MIQSIMEGETWDNLKYLKMGIFVIKYIYIDGNKIGIAGIKIFNKIWLGNL